VVTFTLLSLYLRYLLDGRCAPEPEVMEIRFPQHCDPYSFRILDDAQIPWTSNSEENIWAKES
jgi:hypothetical protein